MRNGFISASSGNQDESSNAMIQSIVPSSRKRPRISNFPPTNQPNKQFGINMMMGNMTDCNFYVPDATGDATGLSFRVAYNAASKLWFDSTSKELSAYVGSMLCSVVPAFRNSVEAALNGVGIRPNFISLPSQARKNKIEISEVPKLDWSCILVIFGYCVLILFKIDSKSFESCVGCARDSLHTARIDELRRKVGCPHYHHSNIPFEQVSEISVRTRLGTDPQIRSLCQYLSYVLSWSGDLRVFTLMNEKLVKTKSHVLSDSRVIAEVENLEELVKAIESHTYPQFFNHLCLTSELFYLDVSRFPNLFAVARVLKEEKDVKLIKYLSSSEFPGANDVTVEELVELHRASMARNQVSTVRRIEPIVDI